jgi:polysaccharide deacetylase 2 family uncharacterized protein YibQ
LTKIDVGRLSKMLNNTSGSRILEDSVAMIWFTSSLRLN